MLKRAFPRVSSKRGDLIPQYTLTCNRKEDRRFKDARYLPTCRQTKTSKPKTISNLISHSLKKRIETNRPDILRVHATYIPM